MGGKLRECLWLVCLLGMCPVPAAAAEAKADYLSPELRTRVDALKASARAEPSKLDNARERALTLYDWINAFALNGGYVPVNATAVVAQISAYGAPAYSDLDAFIRELALHDDDPAALGSFEASDLGPFTAATPVSFDQTYTLGNAAMVPGGGFLVARHFQGFYPDFQTRDPRADNYVSVSSSNDQARFKVDSISLSGMHGGFRSPEPALVFRLQGTVLKKGDTVTIHYGDRRGGSRGLLMSDLASERMPFPVYLDLDASNTWLSLPIQPIRVQGGPVAGVHIFAPSIVATNEAFELSIRAEDPYGNRATGKVPAWELLLNGKPSRRLPSKAQAITLLDDLRFKEPGVYRFSVRSSDGQITGVANPILVKEAPEQRIFWGDTHGHSGFSEGIGTAREFMRYALEDSRLDYVTHSEHDVWLDDYEWEVLKSMVREFHVDGRFAPYLGYEWTISRPQGGHHNVLFRYPVGGRPIAAQRYPTLSRLYQGLRENYALTDVVVIPHAHNTGDYRQSDPELETLVEIASMHGTFEWFGRMYLQHGHEVGFVAASDDHLAKPGYSTPRRDSLAQRGGLGAILAKEHSSDAIFDGMKALRTYATTGDRMIVDFSVNGAMMGSRTGHDDVRRISGRVIGTGPIDRISVMRNDEEIWHHDYYQRTLPAHPGTGEITLQVSFFSEAYPKQPPDNPRGWRHWRGTLEVRGATLVDAGLTDQVNLETQFLTREESVVRFATNTRGDHSSINLKLEDFGPDAQLTLVLEETTETGSAPPFLRRHATIPGERVVFELGDLDAADLKAPMTLDGFEDLIQVRVVDSTAPDDVSFNIVDEDGGRHGDYYYVRVRQANDAMAWSSPVWVGGHPPR